MAARTDRPQGNETTNNEIANVNDGNLTITSDFDHIVVTAKFWLSGIFRDSEPELYQINYLFSRSISVLQSSSGELKI